MSARVVGIDAHYIEFFEIFELYVRYAAEFATEYKMKQLF
jgi:hypothetical protein